MTQDFASPMRSRQAFGRAFWSGADAAASPIAALLMTAGLVRCLGARDYGLMVIALAASGLATAISPAIAATTTKFVSHAIGTRERTGRLASRTLTASLLVLAAISVCLLAVTAVLRNPLAHAVFGEASSASAGDVLLLAIVGMCIQQIDAVLAAALKGLERFKQQALIEMGSRLLGAILVVAAAWHTRDVRVALLAQCAVSLGVLAVRSAALRTSMPGARLFARPGRPDYAAILGFGGWMWLSAAAGMAYYSVDRIIVGHVLGAVALAQFNIFLQVGQLVHYVPSSVFAFAFPVFSRLSAEGGQGRAEIVHCYRNYVALSIGAALAIAVAIVALQQPLLQLFAGGVVYAGQQPVLAWLTFAFLLLSCNSIAYYLLLALGRSKQVSLIGTASMLVALVLAVMLVPRYGLYGAAFSRLAYGLGNFGLLASAQHSLRRL